MPFIFSFLISYFSFLIFFPPGVPYRFKRDFSLHLICTFNKKVKGDAGPKKRRISALTQRSSFSAVKKVFCREVGKTVRRNKKVHDAFHFLIPYFSFLISHSLFLIPYFSFLISYFYITEFNKPTKTATPTNEKIFSAHFIIYQYY